MSTIRKYIALDGTRDAVSIQDAFDLCLNDGNDYILTIMDFGIYREQAVLGERSNGGLVTLQANKISRYNRPTMIWSGSDGDILNLKANHIIKGIKFVYDEPVQGLAFRRAVHSASAKVGITSEVSHCQFYLGGRYHYDDPPPIDEYGHVGYWADYDTASVKVYNNLFRGCAYAGVRYDPKAGNSIIITKNTFVKCEECIWVESRVDGVQTIKNNIFDLDGNYSPDCWKFAAVYVNVNCTPTQLGGLDYNIYYNRAIGPDRLPPMGHPNQLKAFLSFNSSYVTRALLNAAHPTQEVHGYDHDPEFHEYCVNYHLDDDSYALQKGLYNDGYLDDNDGIPRPALAAAGCCDLCGELIDYFPWPDEGDVDVPTDTTGEDFTLVLA